MDNLWLLFDTSGFRQRWECGSWTLAHGWLHIASDLGVWSAYVAIPLVLASFLFRRKDLPFRGIFVLFVAFILACGTTHLMDALLFVWPAYRLAGVIKLATALVSWATVIALIPTIPKVLAIRNPAELEAEIQERKQVEESLRQSEERFRLLVEGTADYAILMLNPEGYVVSWNSGARRIEGYRTDEIVQHHFSCFYTPEDVQQGKPQAALATATAEGRYEDESWRVRKDGSRYWANVIITPLRDTQGELVGFLKIIRDITERKRAETALNETQRFVERIAEMIPSILYVYDLNEQRNIFVNHRVQSILGYSPDETTQTGANLALDHVHPEDMPRVVWTNKQYQAAKDGAVIEKEFRMRHANGEWRWLHSRDTVFVRDENGHPRQILGVAQDITERKRLEQEVLEIAALEQRRIGQELHDGTGQELTGLCMLADNLADALREYSPEEAQMAHRIAVGLKHALGQVRALSRGLIPVEVDAEGLMAALAELTDRIGKLHNIHCTFECAEPVPVEDNFTATQLYRIAQEAITNALKHSKAGNIRVSLETRGRYITLRVNDDGVGLADIDRTIEGMGLRIMKYRASQIGAHFALRPGPTRGTVVTCTLFRGTIHD